jgi:hypothetical protein
LEKKYIHFKLQVLDRRGGNQSPVRDEIVLHDAATEQVNIFKYMHVM